MNFRSLVSLMTAITTGGAAFNPGAALADTLPGPYIGAQMGAGDIDWYDNHDFSPAGAVNVGYDFNQYIAAEAGYNYLGHDSDTTTQAGDLVAKIHVPVIDNFGLFAKTGAGYLHFSGGGPSASDVNLVYGAGVDYKILPHWVADASFTRFNGKDKTPNFFNNNYAPNADLYALGLTYKFKA